MPGPTRLEPRPLLMSQRTGILYLVSGPSGSGKTTLCRQLARNGEAHYSVSCTTRPPRPGEVDGRDYNFLSREDFERDIAAGEFLEHAEVHGNHYGTLCSEVLGFIDRGKDVVMDIDVQGAAQVRASGDPAIQKALVDLFVMPPSEEELHERLANRATDAEDVIALRMKNALEEMEHWRKYTYCLISGSKEEDYARFTALLTAERLRSARRP